MLSARSLGLASSAPHHREDERASPPGHFQAWAQSSVQWRSDLCSRVGASPAQHHQAHRLAQLLRHVDRIKSNMQHEYRDTYDDVRGQPSSPSMVRYTFGTMYSGSFDRHASCRSLAFALPEVNATRMFPAATTAVSLTELPTDLMAFSISPSSIRRPLILTWQSTRPKVFKSSFRE